MVLGNGLKFLGSYRYNTLQYVTIRYNTVHYHLWESSQSLIVMIDHLPYMATLTIYGNTTYHLWQLPRT